MASLPLLTVNWLLKLGLLKDRILCGGARPFDWIVGLAEPQLVRPAKFHRMRRLALHEAARNELMRIAIVHEMGSAYAAAKWDRDEHKQAWNAVHLIEAQMASLGIPTKEAINDPRTWLNSNRVSEIVALAKQPANQTTMNSSN